jgi:flagellar motility protein MotE (MotC chaperone)
MIAGKNTLEVAGPRKRSDEHAPCEKEFHDDAFCRDDKVCPLDDLEFGEIGLEANPIESRDNQKRLAPEKQVDKKIQLRLWDKLYDLPRKYYLVLGLILVCLVIGIYLLAAQTYTVETRLVFVIGDQKILDKEGWSPVREMSVLQNPGTVSLLSKRYYNGFDPINLFSKKDKSVFDSIPFGSTVVDPTTVNKNHFKKSTEFESWLSKSIAFEPDFNNGQNRVALKLNGHDPSFLKGVLQDYVGSYVDLRRAINSRSKEKVESSAQKDGDTLAKEKSVRNVDERIEKLDALKYEYKLALKLMDSGSGSFAALSSDSNSGVSKTLSKFQDKIIQLEIERSSLEARYTPQSREIKSIDFQIQGVKGLMKQYLVEQIDYLKKDRDLLFAQKNELEGKTAETQLSAEPKNLGKPAGMLATGAKWYMLNDGLSVITETPFITSKPFLSKLADAKDAFVSSLFASTSNRNAPRPSFDQRVMNPYAGPQYQTPAMQGMPIVNSYGPPQSMELYRNDMRSFGRQ